MDSNTQYLQVLYNRQQQQSQIKTKFDVEEAYYGNSNQQFFTCASLLQEMAMFYRMDKRTTHYAISYLDILLRQGIIRTLQTTQTDIESAIEFSCTSFTESGVVCACLLIASKFNDAYDIIRASKLIKFVNNNYSQFYDSDEQQTPLREHHIHSLEKTCLAALDHDLYKVLPVDFIEHLNKMDLVHDEDNIFDSGFQTLFSLTPFDEDDNDQFAKTQYEWLQDSRQIQIQSKVGANVEQLTQLVMGRYSMFRDQKCSDISISIILCARVLAGIENNEEIFLKLLKRFHFESWSKQRFFGYQTKLSKGALKLLVEIIAMNKDQFHNHELYLLQRQFKQYLSVMPALNFEIQDNEKSTEKINFPNITKSSTNIFQQDSLKNLITPQRIPQLNGVLTEKKSVFESGQPKNLIQKMAIPKSKSSISSRKQRAIKALQNTYVTNVALASRSSQRTERGSESNMSDRNWVEMLVNRQKSSMYGQWLMKGRSQSSSDKVRVTSETINEEFEQVIQKQKLSIMNKLPPKVSRQVHPKPPTGLTSQSRIPILKPLEAIQRTQSANKQRDYSQNSARALENVNIRAPLKKNAFQSFAENFQNTSRQSTQSSNSNGMQRVSKRTSNLSVSRPEQPLEYSNSKYANLAPLPAWKLLTRNNSSNQKPFAFPTEQASGKQ